MGVNRYILAMCLSLLAPALAAQSLVATRSISSRSLIGPDDVALVERDIPGALTRIEDAVGQEARVNLYSGRAVRPGDVSTPAVVERNDVVMLRFKRGGLMIQTEGRALDRASLGDVLRVMNLSSKSIVSGFVRANSIVEVGQ